MSEKLSAAPKLSSLPPANEAFAQNVLRACCQFTISLSTLDPDLPVMDRTILGHESEETNESLVQVMPPPNVSDLPKKVLKLMTREYRVDEPCRKVVAHAKIYK